jgi:hypothetical protein
MTRTDSCLESHAAGHWLAHQFPIDNLLGHIRRSVIDAGFLSEMTIRNRDPARRPACGADVLENRYHVIAGQLKLWPRGERSCFSIRRNVHKTMQLWTNAQSKQRSRQCGAIIKWESPYTLHEQFGGSDEL